MENLQDALNSYFTAASMSGLYWNLYAGVVFGILGWLFTKKPDFDVPTKAVLTVVFLVFSIGNLSMLINKQTIHEAMAYEVVRHAQSLSVCPGEGEKPCKSKQLDEKLDEVCGFLPYDCLHATKWWSMALIHLLFDTFVLVALWWIRPRRETGEQVET